MFATENRKQKAENPPFLLLLTLLSHHFVQKNPLVYIQDQQVYPFNSDIKSVQYCHHILRPHFYSHFINIKHSEKYPKIQKNTNLQELYHP